MVKEESHEKVHFKLKFEKCGTDPLNHEPMNIIKQLNQQHTYLVFKRVEYLLIHYSEYGPFTMNHGTASGYVIESENSDLVGEVFSAVDPINNQKLKKSIIRMVDAVADKNFFYQSPLRYKGEDRLKNNMKVLKLYI